MNLSSTVARAALDPLLNPATAFNRLFPQLPAWQPPGRTEAKQIAWIADLADGMFQGKRGENPAIPAGYTYFGQLINHDLTFDAQSGLLERLDPARLRAIRPPRFDLDSVYGRGPQDEPQLYLYSNPTKLLEGRNQDGELDIPRNRDTSTDRYGTTRYARYRPALTADARDDETIMIGQMHLALIRFHNRRIDEGATFDEARRLTRWHYQWVALHDFLTRLCGADTVTRTLNSYRDGSGMLSHVPPRPFLPIEFSVAAYRFGHAMVRDTYDLNDWLHGHRGALNLFESGVAEYGLGGGRELPPGWTIQWELFVNSGISLPQNSMLISPALSPRLRNLPIRDPKDNRERSLAFRTLQRGWRLALPSGQQVAAALKQRPLDGVRAGFEDPLWIYVLREAQLSSGGVKLGAVGAEIVAQVFVGCLLEDPGSFLHADPEWTPVLPAQRNSFGLRDLLFHAGMPMTRDDWNLRPGAGPGGPPPQP